MQCNPLPRCKKRYWKCYFEKQLPECLFLRLHFVVLCLGAGESSHIKPTQGKESSKEIKLFISTQLFKLLTCSNGTLSIHAYRTFPPSLMTNWQFETHLHFDGGKEEVLARYSQFPMTIKNNIEKDFLSGIIFWSMHEALKVNSFYGTSLKHHYPWINLNWPLNW